MPDDRTLLEQLKRNCLEAVRIIGMGLGPVVILGKSFNETGPLEKTAQAVGRWLAGNTDAKTDQVLSKLRDEYARTHHIPLNQGGSVV